METPPPAQRDVQPGAPPPAPDTSARMLRLRSPFLPNLRRHLEFDGMHKPGSPAVGGNGHPVLGAPRGRPLVFPRLAVAKEIDLAKPLGVGLLRGEIRQHLER